MQLKKSQQRLKIVGNTMAILINKDTKLFVRAYGAQGSFHSEQCKAYGTQMVGGVTPGKGGTTHIRSSRFQYRFRS
jgi:succinyl-CoA synthetase alpha subunit